MQQSLLKMKIMFGASEKKFKDEKKIVIQQQRANAEKAAELEKQEADLKAEKEKLTKDKKEVKEEKEKVKKEKKQIAASMENIKNIELRLQKQAKMFEEYCVKMESAVTKEKEAMFTELKLLRGELKKMSDEIVEMKTKMACVEVMQVQLNELRGRVDSLISSNKRRRQRERAATSE